MKPGTSKESAAPGGQATATGKAPEVTHSHSVTSDRLQEADPLLGWFGRWRQAIEASPDETRMAAGKR